MTGQRVRASGPDLDMLRRRIWVYRSRGMTIRQIAENVGKSTSNVQYHLKKYREETFSTLDGAGQDEALGELVLAHSELLAEALRNMTQVEQGSPLRAQWLEVAARRLDAKKRFMLDVGIITKAADRVELTVRDVRKMSDEEIEREIEQLKEELTMPPVELSRRGELPGVERN